MKYPILLIAICLQLGCATKPQYDETAQHLSAASDASTAIKTHNAATMSDLDRIDAKASVIDTYWERAK